MSQSDDPDDDVPSPFQIDPALRRHVELAKLEPRMAPKLILEIEEALQEIPAHGDAARDAHLTLLIWLSDALLQSPDGNRADNIERCITTLDEALSLADPETYRRQRGTLLMTLASAYDQRVRGVAGADRERALTLYQQAQACLTREDYPVEWATIQERLAILYEQRALDTPASNQEMALLYHETAQEVLTRLHHPAEWGQIQANLGQLYLERVSGDPQDNLERAVACFEDALDMLEYRPSMHHYGAIQRYLGGAYARLAHEHRVGDLDRARRHLDHAAHIFDAESYALQHREIQLDIAQIEANRTRWEAVHEAYMEVRQLESAALREIGQPADRDQFLRQGRDAAIRDGFALVQLQRYAEAAVTVERGRTREITELQTITGAPVAAITNPDRRARFEKARSALLERQQELYLPVPHGLNETQERSFQHQRDAAYNEARAIFERVADDIRTQEGLSGFLDPQIEAADLLNAAAQCGQRHAIVYLLATPWGGTALTCSNSQTAMPEEMHFQALALPQLTDRLVRELVETPLDTLSGRRIGGFGYAQEYIGYRILFNRFWWQGTTLSTQAAVLQDACSAEQKASTLLVAAQRVLANSHTASLGTTPSANLSIGEQRRLNGTLSHAFLQEELQRCLPVLSLVAMVPLIEWLQGQNVTSFTLIPCGALAAFPLGAAPLSSGQTVADTLGFSVAPSARSLLGAPKPSHRSGVYAIGDTRSGSGAQPLPYSKTEAQAIAALALSSGLASHVVIQNQATLESTYKALATGQVFHAACHGHFDSQDFLRSALLLANGEQLSLGDMLRRVVALDGLRLCVLSACQTAVLDLRGATDEMRSLAAGIVQAGAQAVIASLWPVGDRPTYLLMTRFASEWFPHMEREAPARALARAQQWLRTGTWKDLRQWEGHLADLLATSAIASPTSTGERGERGDAAPGSAWHSKLWWSLTHDRQERSPQPEPTEVVSSAPASRASDLQESQLPLISVRGGDERYSDDSNSQSEIRTSTIRGSDHPFADPIFWAGFQVTGW